MKNSEIVLKAAELLFEYPEIEYSCNAIEHPQVFNDFKRTEKLIQNYTNLFSPEPDETRTSWLCKISGGPLMPEKNERHQWRLTALCFYAAMLEKGAS